MAPEESVIEIQKKNEKEKYVMENIRKKMVKCNFVPCPTVHWCLL